MHFYDSAPHVHDLLSSTLRLKKKNQKNPPKHSIHNFKERHNRKRSKEAARYQKVFVTAATGKTRCHRSRDQDHVSAARLQQVFRSAQTLRHAKASSGSIFGVYLLVQSAARLPPLPPSLSLHIGHSSERAPRSISAHRMTVFLAERRLKIHFLLSPAVPPSPRVDFCFFYTVL